MQEYVPKRLPDAFDIQLKYALSDLAKIRALLFKSGK
jgi:hypothetical protein